MSIMVLGGRNMLKNSRKKLGLSQAELARKIGIKQSYLSKIENLKFNNVTIKLIKKNICRIASKSN